MQRKNHLLRKRGGFAIIMAIAVIFAITTIIAISLSMSAQTTKRSTDIYLYEQAVLLSKSAAEYALLRISQDGPCSPTTLNFTPDIDGNASTPDIYDINITMKYIYKSPSPCASANDDYFNIVTPEQNGSVLMDITVSIPTSTNVSSEPITYFRRSIQKL